MKANVYNSTSDQPVRVIDIAVNMIPQNVEQEDALFELLTYYLQMDNFAFTAIVLEK